VDSLFKHYQNSSLGGHFNGLRTHDRLRVSYTGPNIDQDIFRDVSPATRAITRGLGILMLVERCPAHLRLDLLKGYLLT
jgi:hypothetical protein